MSNDKKLKKYLGVFACIIITILVYIYMCIIFTPKDISNAGGPLYYRGMGFMSEPANSIDIMVYGNSDVYSGFVPARLFEHHGYTSYASGRANQTVEETVTLLKDTLENQKPKLVVLETDCFFANAKKFKLDTGNILLAPFLYHSRWKEISGRDFVDIPNRSDQKDFNKGFLPSKLTFKSDKFGNYMKNNGGKPAHISKENKAAIDEFVELCKKNQIPVLFVELPSPSSWNYNKHLAVSKIAEKYNVDFVDLNMESDGYKVDLLKDFRDEGNHMNTFGATRVTDFLGEYINKEYGSFLNDKRNEEGFKIWHKTVKKYYDSI